MVGASIAGSVLALGLVGVSPASAKTALPVWSSASELSVSTAVSLVSLDCPSPGNCVAVGSEALGSSATSDGAEPVVVRETGGVWGHPIEVALPANGIRLAAAQNAGLDSVTCTSPGNCVAVGYYSDNNSQVSTGDSLQDSQAMVAAETGGVWGAAREVALPANATAAAGMQYAALESVTCTSRGNCVAVGDYADPTGSNQAMAVAETRGAWGRASELTLPADATTAPDDGDAALDSVTCTSPGGCVAVGRYTDSSSDGHAMVVAETRGVWGHASAVTLPANALTASVSQDLDSVTCTGPGDCVAVGNYTASSDPTTSASLAPLYDGYQAMVVAETRGVWGRASEVTPPAQAGATEPGGGLEPDLNSVTCTSLGNCVAVGGAYSLATVVVETGGVWGQASEVTPPASATTIAAGQQSDLTSVTCTSLASCDAIGSYTVRAGTQTMTVSLVRPTVATVGNRRIMLLTSSPQPCTARAGGLAVAFDSAVIPKSRGEKLRFSSAAFSIGKGVKHTRRQTVRTANGAVRHERVTVFVPNALAHHVPLRTNISLAGLKVGTHTLIVVVSYRETKRRHRHVRLLTKTLSAKFSVC